MKTHDEKGLVIKFGGTSVADPTRMRQAARRIAFEVGAGRVPVVVVSAPGESTDRILGWVAAVADGDHQAWPPSAADGPSVTTAVAGEVDGLHGVPAPGHRESDRALATGEDFAASLIALALSRIGVPARSLRGAEAGVRATGAFGAGVVSEVDPGPVLTLIEQGIVPVVSGFQAADGTGETLTLGRGGSDWTAVLFASVLNTSECHIVTDVAAVFDRDPRAHTEARPYRRISHERLHTLVAEGSRVVHPDAARLALSHRIPLRIFGFWADPGVESGTLVDDRPGEEWADAHSIPWRLAAS